MSYDDLNDFHTYDTETGFSNAVESVESKMHKIFIRYLLSKGYSPRVIRRDLMRLGFSSPMESVLATYWLEFIDPFVQQFQLGHIYSGFKAKLLKPGGNQGMDFAKNHIRFDSLKNSVKDQKNFILFTQKLDINDLWLTEMTSFYGDPAVSPIGEDGKRLLKNFAKVKRPFDIIQSPRRYIIDEMLLDGVSFTRIANYARENLGMKEVSPDSVRIYNNIFFCAQLESIGNQISYVEREIEDITDEIESLNMRLRGHVEIDEETEITTTQQTLRRRRMELEDSLRRLNELHHQSSVSKSIVKQEDYHGMMDMAARQLFEKFQMMAGHNDRDAVAPMVQLVKGMGYAMEKATEFKNFSDPSGAAKHGESATVTMVSARASELAEERAAALRNIMDKGSEYVLISDSPDEDPVDIASIGGIEELNIMTGGDDGNQKEE